MSGPIDLDALEAVLSSISEPPWSAVVKAPMPGMAVATTGDGRCTWIVYGGGHRGMPDVDAAGIVALVNAAPAMIARVRELEAALTNELVVAASPFPPDPLRCPSNECRIRKACTRVPEACPTRVGITIANADPEPVAMTAVTSLAPVHADGGACHGTPLVDGTCPKCGLAVDMQSIELWPITDKKGG